MNALILSFGIITKRDTLFYRVYPVFICTVQAPVIVTDKNISFHPNKIEDLQIILTDRIRCDILRIEIRIGSDTEGL